ncbi:MAG: twin-arginine translocase TatA/TatE family subunit [Gammaproteobacteria bacterium]
MGFSVTELLIILVIVVLLFGTKKLKSIGGDLGGAIKSFRGAMGHADESDTTPAPPRVSHDVPGDAVDQEPVSKSEKDRV